MEDFKTLPKMEDWSHLTVPTSQFQIADYKPSHTFHFHRSGDGSGEAVGVLDFNGPYMKFEGNAEESAVIFFNWVAKYFDQRLKDEYQSGYNAGQIEEREACAKVCENRPTGTAHDNGKACANAIRARGEA